MNVLEEVWHSVYNKSDFLKKSHWLALLCSFDHLPEEEDVHSAPCVKLSQDGGLQVALLASV